MRSSFYGVCLMLSSHHHHHHPLTFLRNHSLFQKVTLSYKQIEQQMSDLSFLTTTDLTKPYIFNPKIDTHSGFEFSIQSLLEWFGSTKEILNETLPPTIHARYVDACCCVLLHGVACDCITCGSPTHCHSFFVLNVLVSCCFCLFSFGFCLVFLLFAFRVYH